MNAFIIMIIIGSIALFFSIRGIYKTEKRKMKVDHHLSKYERDRAEIKRIQEIYGFDRPYHYKNRFIDGLSYPIVKRGKV